MMPGTLHPVTQYLRRSMAVFTKLGFTVLDSPEVVSEAHNFDALLIPKDHPARRMQDTFWLTDLPGRQAGGRYLPRTHTSAHQVPAMKAHKPPVRFVIPGRAFRNEATDATHETSFYQLEGFVIDETTSLSNLKWTLREFMKAMYGSDIRLKFVPSYFPFVEPGFEVFAEFSGRWVELLGAGMIHPGVLANMGVDPEYYQGFAFGMGVDRLVMLQHGIDDIRYLYSGNLRFLGQFKEVLR